MQENAWCPKCKLYSGLIEGEKLLGRKKSPGPESLALNFTTEEMFSFQEIKRD